MMIDYCIRVRSWWLTLGSLRIGLLLNWPVRIKVVRT